MDFLIHHMLHASAERSPEKEALVDGDRRLGYRELAQRAGGLAKGLRWAGLVSGGRVGIYLEPSVAQVVSIFGISEAGGVYVPVNATLFPEQVVHIAQDCGMKGLITTPVKLATLAELIQHIPTLEFVVLTGEEDTPEIKLPVHRLEGLYRLSVAPEWREQSVSNDLAAIRYTSASTGKTKVVMLRHATFI